MASEQGKTRFAILGFLGWRPMSGYDIKRLVDISLSYFWNISYGQIYPILKRLEKEGLARSQSSESDSGRPRHVYHITPKGQEALGEWLQQPVDLSIQRDEMQLKLFVGGHLDRDRMVRLIEDFRAQQSARLQTLEQELTEILPSIRSGALPDELAWLEPPEQTSQTGRQEIRAQAVVFKLSIRQGILKAKARIDWCDEAIETLTNPDSPLVR